MTKEKLPFHEQARALRDIDKELVSLVARRAVLVSELKPSSPSQAKRKQWQELERELWQLWEQEAQACRSDMRSWRKVFSLLQELTAQAEPEEASRAYVLSPRREPMRIDMRGPGCTLSSRLWAVLAAQTLAPMSVGNVLRNDSLVELAKGLNQAGASLYWDDAGLHSRGASKARFGEGVVFAGSNSLNLMLLVALCLGRAGSARFTGGAGLKLLDLAPLRGFLPQLGARMAFMHPGSSSVPFRLECSGVLPETVRLPGDMPVEMAADLALALCVAAPAYEGGLHLRWGDELEERVAPLVALGVHILESCGLRAELQTGALTVHPGEAALPADIMLPLDPCIATTFLAAPLFAGGTASLHGTWPAELPQWRSATAVLESSGLEVGAKPGAVTSAPATGFRFREVTVGAALDILPLALSMAAWQALQGQKTARLRVAPAGAHELRASRELCELLGLSLEEEGDVLVLRKDPEAVTGVQAFVAPDARWCMAAALASFAMPGLELSNPGEVSELMPNFWRYFNALPDPGRESSRKRVPESQEESNGKKRRRRIVT